MNELSVTVSGWVATDPKHSVGPTGVHLTSFRLASTPRFFDRAKQEWTDGQTEWFSVRVFRGASITVAGSVKKGQPVIVRGRLRTNEWESDSGTRHEMQIDATSVGHDLTLGTADFTRAVGDPSLTSDGRGPVEPATDDAGAEGEPGPDAEVDIDADGDVSVADQDERVVA